MFAYIKGVVTELTPTYLIVESNSIGYYIRISLNTYEYIKTIRHNSETQIKILTLVHIKEDAHTIYGFADKYELDVFKLLITVNGIGHTTASVVLSYMSPKEFEDAVREKRVDLIKRVKGIGDKSAHRIILELQDKLTKSSSKEMNLSIPANQSLKNLAVETLVTLGFHKVQVEKIVSKVIQNASITNVEQLVKEALKYL